MLKAFSVLNPKTQSRADFNMVYCPSGTCEVRLSDEKSSHLVAFSKPFWIGETAVTQELMNQLGFGHRSYVRGAKNPVTNISYYQSILFCNFLSELEDLNPCYHLSRVEMYHGHVKSAVVDFYKHRSGYRLPSVSEWHYSTMADDAKTHLNESSIWEWTHDAHESERILQEKAKANAVLDWRIDPYFNQASLRNKKYSQPLYSNEPKAPERQVIQSDDLIDWHKDDCANFICKRVDGGAIENRSYHRRNMDDFLGLRLCKNA